MEQDQFAQGTRLEKVIKALNLNQSSFAQSLGMTQPNISRMVRGESKISIEVLNGITRAYTQVNLHWLLTGNGEMFLENSSQVTEERRSAIVKGKGKLEELEDRIEQLEQLVKQLLRNY